MKAYIPKSTQESSPIIYKHKLTEIKDIKLSTRYEQFRNNLNMNKYTEFQDQQLNTSQILTQSSNQFQQFKFNAKLEEIASRFRQYLNEQQKTPNGISKTEELIQKIQSVNQKIDKVSLNLSQIKLQQNLSQTDQLQLQQLKHLLELNVQHILQNFDQIINIQNKIQPLTAQINYIDEQVSNLSGIDFSSNKLQLQTKDKEQEITLNLKIQELQQQLQQQIDLSQKTTIQHMDEKFKLENIIKEQNQLIQQQQKNDYNISDEKKEQITLQQQDSKSQQLDEMQKQYNNDVDKLKLIHQQQLNKLLDQIQQDKQKISNLDAEILKLKNSNINPQNQPYDDSKLNELQKLYINQHNEINEIKKKKFLVDQQVLQLQKSNKEDQITIQNQTTQLTELNNQIEQIKSQQQYNQSSVIIDVNQTQQQSSLVELNGQKYVKMLKQINNKLTSLVQNKYIVELAINNHDIATIILQLQNATQLQNSGKNAKTIVKQTNITKQTVISGQQISKTIIQLMKDFKTNKLIQRNSFDNFVKIINAALVVVSDDNIMILSKLLQIQKCEQLSIKESFYQFIRQNYSYQLEFFINTYAKQQITSLNIGLPELSLDRNQSSINNQLCYLTDKLDNQLSQVLFDICVQLVIHGFELDLEQQPNPGNIIVWPRLFNTSQNEQIAMVQMKQQDLTE